MQNDMLGTFDVAKLLRCSESTARRLLDELGQQGYTISRLTNNSPRRISRQDLQRYAESKGFILDWSTIQ